MKGQGFSVPQNPPHPGQEATCWKKNTQGEAVFWGALSKPVSFSHVVNILEGMGQGEGQRQVAGSPSSWGTSLLDRTIYNCGEPVKRMGSLLRHRSQRHSPCGPVLSRQLAPNSLCSHSSKIYSLQEQGVLTGEDTKAPSNSAKVQPMLWPLPTHPLESKEENTPLPTACPFGLYCYPLTLMDSFCIFPVYVQ